MIERHRCIVRSIVCCLTLFVAFSVSAVRGDEFDPDGPNYGYDNTSNFECVASFGEDITNFIAQGNYVYLAQGYTLRVIDISTPASPKEVGWLRLSGEIHTMDIKGTMLFLATGSWSNGLKVVDISDPAKPRVRSALPMNNRGLWSRRMGDLLFVDAAGKYGNGYEIYNIADASNPVSAWQGHFSHPFSTDGKHIFGLEWTDYNARLVAVVDRTTSRTIIPPVRAADSDEPAFGCDRGHLYLANVLSTASANARVVPPTYNLPLPVQAPQVWAFHSSSLYTQHIVDQWIFTEGVNLNDNTQYLLARKSEPGKTVLYLETSNGDETAVDLNSQALYSVTDAKLTVYDLTTKTVPLRQESLPGPAKMTGPIQINGSLLIANSDEGLKIFDISNPLKPRLTGEYRTFKGIEKAVVSGDRGYLISGSSELLVLDTTNPLRPRLLARKNVTEGTSIEAIDGYRVFLGAQARGFSVWDLSEPKHPVSLGQYTGESGPMDVSGDKVYMSVPGEGFKILETKKPGAILPIGSFKTRGECSGVAALGSTVYALDGEVLDVVDAGNPGSPVLREKVNLPFPVQADYDEELADSSSKTNIRRMDSTLIVTGKMAGPGRGFSIAVDASDPSTCTVLSVIVHDSALVDANEVSTDTRCLASPPWRTIPGPATYIGLPTFRHDTGGDEVGLDFYDVSVPAKPRWAGCYERQSSDDPVLGKGWIFAPAGSDGLLVLRHVPPPKAK